MSKKVPILIVDDLPQNILALEAVIADMGVDIKTALSGNDALRQSLQHDFALILLDVQMPDMDGFEVARLIRANPKTRHFPIIFVTAGMKDLLNQLAGYETGAVDYLIKPFEPFILRSKVKVFRELYQ
jgi:two-component system, sensor histidine kinase and response regulator